MKILSREIFNDKVLYFNNNKSEDLEKLMEDMMVDDPENPILDDIYERIEKLI